MNTLNHKTGRDRSLSGSSAATRETSGNKHGFRLVDNRPENIAQRKLQEVADKSVLLREVDGPKPISSVLQLQQSPVIQFGSGMSTTKQSGGGGKKPNNIDRFKSKGAKQYPDHNYEKWYRQRDVRIADLQKSEGDKPDQELHDALVQNGFDRRFSILVIEEADGTLRVIDGHHRLTEMESLGETHIPAFVIPRKAFDKQEKMKGAFYKSGQGW